MTAVSTPAILTSEQLLARLLYRDALMLIIDKPAGLAVHPGPKGGPNLEDLLDGCTSVCLVVRGSRIGSIATPAAA